MRRSSLSPLFRPAHRIIALATIGLTLAVHMALVPPTAGAGDGAIRAGSLRPDRPRLSTPALIDRAVKTQVISRAEGARLLTFALIAPDRLPLRYRSDAPWDGTIPLLELRRTAPTLGHGPAAAEVRAGLLRIANVPCPGASGTLPAARSTAHFYVQYNPRRLVGLGIGAYLNTLEKTWKTEVGEFGWAAPPRDPTHHAPGGRYPVRIQNLGSGLYGYVASTHIVGNNPRTAWADRDATSSCMVLNQNFTPFPGTATDALHATTAHEFNHSLQFGYGALSGPTKVKSVWVEGGATWMEDEVFDSANDNYTYLWPDVRKPMPLFDPSFPYPYWVVFRAMTEPFGTGTAGGGQTIFRYFWEQLSRNASTNTTAFKRAFMNAGSTLAAAYHGAGVALRFNVACGGSTPEPYCLEEGPGYVASGTARSDNAFVNAGTSKALMIANDFATVWVGLTASGTYPLTVEVAPGDLGQLMVSAVCETGGDLVVTPLGTATASTPITMADYDAAGCDGVTAVVSNVRMTSTTPTSRSTTHYTFSAGS